MPMTQEYALAKQTKRSLEQEVERTSKALREIGLGTGPMGFTPEHILSSPAFQQAKQAYGSAFQALRAFNRVFVKRFKKEYAEERRNRQR